MGLCLCDAGCVNIIRLLLYTRLDWVMLQLSSRVPPAGSTSRPARPTRGWPASGAARRVSVSVSAQAEAHHHPSWMRCCCCLRRGCSPTRPHSRQPRRRPPEQPAPGGEPAADLHRTRTATLSRCLLPLARTRVIHLRFNRVLAALAAVHRRGRLRLQGQRFPPRHPAVHAAGVRGIAR